MPLAPEAMCGLPLGINNIPYSGEKLVGIITWRIEPISISLNLAAINLADCSSIIIMFTYHIHTYRHRKIGRFWQCT